MQVLRVALLCDVLDGAFDVLSDSIWRAKRPSRCSHVDRASVRARELALKSPHDPEFKTVEKGLPMRRTYEEISRVVKFERVLIWQPQYLHKGRIRVQKRPI